MNSESATSGTVEIAEFNAGLQTRQTGKVCNLAFLASSGGKF